MKNYDFERILKFNNDMLLSFEVDDLIAHNEYNYDNFIEKIDDDNKIIFFEKYGHSINKEDIKEKLKEEILRLTEEEEYIVLELINYIGEKIKKENLENKKSISERLQEYNEDMKTSSYYNIGNYKTKFIYLFSSKNKEEFEKITEELSLKKDFLHYDPLLMKMLTDEKIGKLFKESEAKKIFDIYMNSEYKISSLNQYLNIINNSEEKYNDFDFIRFQKLILSEHGKEIITLTNKNEINNNHLTDKTKELITDFSKKIRDKIKKISILFKKEKINQAKLNYELVLLKSIDEIFKLILNETINKNKDVIHPIDIDFLKDTLNVHNKYINEKTSVLKEDKKNKMKI